MKKKRKKELLDLDNSVVIMGAEGVGGSGRGYRRGDRVMEKNTIKMNKKQSQ